MDLPSTRPSKGRIAARFSRTVEAYESVADVQLEIVERVAELMRGDMGEKGLWCDFGSGSGMLAERLLAVSAGARFVCLDLAFAPLRRALESRRAGMAVCGDIDFPPIRPGALDGASALSVLQWAERPQEALCGIAQALKPGGHFCFAVYVDGSFAELIEMRSRMGLPEVVWLPTVSEFLMMLDRAGFKVAVEDIEHFEKVRKFPDALSVLGCLSRAGVTATGGRLLNRSELDKLCRDYTLTFSKGGTVPLTYRAVIGKVIVRAE
ncbi:MAG: methyltransferase domain-containing protein [Chitinispirillia bacterium]|nr:methyltransferase domain-containing protein [Chitinispirillia bacterium]MCL2267749.1 methyltransferase domain-containing protein [Chitinispirillia bacterium]